MDNQARTCFREAFDEGLIEYDDYWLKVLETRNYTVNTYNEIFAEHIYKELPASLNYFKKLFQAIKKEQKNMNNQSNTCQNCKQEFLIDSHY